MSPSHARKLGIRYRYYVSSPLLHGQAGNAGSVRRVPAAEVEALVAHTVREHLKIWHQLMTETSSAPMSSASKSKRTSWRSNSKHLNKDSLADEKTRRHKSATPASWKQTHGSFRSLAKTAVETAARDHRAEIRGAAGRSPFSCRNPRQARRVRRPWSALAR
jgi:hypothetical protein